MTTGEQIDGLSYALAPKREALAASAVAAAAVTFAILVVPSGKLQTGEVDSFLSAVYAASVVALLVTAAILRNQYRASDYAPFAFLGIAYAYAGTLVVAYLLTFPGVFSRTGLLGAAPQTAEWFWIAWHGGFIALLAIEVLSEALFGGRERPFLIVRIYSVAAIFATAIVISTIFNLGTDLPVLLEPSGYTPLFHKIVDFGLLTPCALVFLGLAVLSRFRQTTNLWIGVVLIALFSEILISGEVAGRRFTVGWYAGRFEGLLSQTIFLTVQVRQMFKLLVSFGEHNRSLAETAAQDALTGLFNRRTFDERFAQMWRQCRRAREPISLVVLDLDHFKLYNDHFGHLAGDEALQAVGAVIADGVRRPTDFCCRIGGEEFAIVLPFTDEAGAIAVAERVRDAVRCLNLEHSPLAPLPVMTVSLGLASTYDMFPLDPRYLHERADQALYRAKRMGRNRLFTFPRVRKLNPQRVVTPFETVRSVARRKNDIS